jgi:hypothetical protein
VLYAFPLNDGAGSQATSIPCSDALPRCQGHIAKRLNHQVIDTVFANQYHIGPVSQFKPCVGHDSLIRLSFAQPLYSSLRFVAYPISCGYTESSNTNP